MHHYPKNFIIKIEYGIQDDSPRIQNRKLSKINWIEALAGLNAILRQIGASEAILTIDWSLSPTGQLLAKRYSDDAILSYSVKNESWSLRSGIYNTVSGNVANLTKYLSLYRQARRLNISITKNNKSNGNESKKLAEKDG